MSVWAVTMVKDEADIIEGALRHVAREGVAGIIVSDNGSTDSTHAIIDDLDASGELGCELLMLIDSDPAYYQSRKMSDLAQLAGTEYGAEWIIPFDADELWLAPDRVGLYLDALPESVTTCPAALFNHYPTAIDECDEDPFRSMVWRARDPLPLDKVAVRWQRGVVIHAGNHGATVPGGPRSDVDSPLTVRHFPYRSEDQFVRKARNGAAAYKATDLPPETGAHWREYGAILERHGEEALREVYRQHFFYSAPVEGGLVLDPAPYRRWERKP